MGHKTVETNLIFDQKQSNRKVRYLTSVQTIFLKNHKQWDLLIFLLLTGFSILNGQTTIFYVLYLFWWAEWLRIIVDKLACKKNPNAICQRENGGSVLHSLIPMLIYFVFIIVFFGIIANWQNKEITIINIGILTFHNLFFNLNLAFILFERIALHWAKQPLQVSFGAFTPNMIILHISIVLGGLLMFFVVRNYPQVFTPENLWGSVILISPFLLLRMLSTRL